MDSAPLLSICCITFNHFNYIRSALGGFINQDVDFPVEILIHDDCSTDGTRKIIWEFGEKYPDKVFPVLQSENQYSKIGPQRMASNFLQQAKGKYIALCEGDDYWTDPLKLRRQVSFLEENPDFSVCFHGCQVLEKGILKDDYITANRLDRGKSVYDTYDLAKGNFVHTPSIVFRNTPKIYQEEMFLRSEVGDYMLLLLLSLEGKIKRLDENMAVYRVHGDGVWSNINEKIKKDKIIAYLRLLEKHFKHPSVNIIASRLKYEIYGRMKSNLKSMRLIDFMTDFFLFIRLRLKYGG
ncbi:Glycosyltransferase involved in cell wall bisynthesis [Aquiflexum balticum DSM 16537]|uniref:Glycosyltransferase involved in cell wall bisynthesis n=1 Tax=Aquiflexum balticum DSM 16537 TaxID=758820 RepID=A0A1W2HBF1_9BACT|nr:glycosyltransferase family 2 protein [Aquiflexum balticum]SMD46058.1 Glycosyltransferase involved in cell wall bisynthesis [Aquiflexum balticum DSM 16537]